MGGSSTGVTAYVFEAVTPIPSFADIPWRGDLVKNAASNATLSAAERKILEIGKPPPNKKESVAAEAS